MAKKEKILVTGGAGYIGSFTVRALQENGYEVIVFDNLDYGHEASVKKTKLVKGDLVHEPDKLEKIFEEYNFSGVVHFAAYALAGESMQKAAKYFENNVLGSLNLLEAMRKSEVSRIVFSSTCAVYGQPKKLPITEAEKKEPESPYGESKLIVEKLMEWYRRLYRVNYVALRYFNAAGAAPDGSMGEDHTPETHLIPLACQTALGLREKMVIFGNDYSTPDGTCVRDYIHVLDLAQAHLLAIKYLKEGGKSDFFNVGTGQGFSVKEVIEATKQVSEVDFKVELGPRRPGDPAYLYADNQKIRKTLSWQPQYPDLKTIVSSAWKWHHRHPKGYEESS